MSYSFVFFSYWARLPWYFWFCGFTWEILQFLNVLCNAISARLQYFKLFYFVKEKYYYLFSVESFIRGFTELRVVLKSLGVDSFEQPWLRYCGPSVGFRNATIHPSPATYLTTPFTTPPSISSKQTLSSQTFSFTYFVKYLGPLTEWTKSFLNRLLLWTSYCSWNPIVYFKFESHSLINSSMNIIESIIFIQGVS